MRITQPEKIVRYLAQRMGQWVPGYELVKNASGDETIIQDADTRAYELAKKGYFDSPNFRYYIEHRKKGKYAEFRVALKTALNILKNETEEMLTDNQKALEWFDKYPT